MIRASRHLSLSFLFLVLLSCAAPDQAQDEFSTLRPGQLQVALYPGFAPVVFHDPDSQEVVGIDVDILKAFANKYGLKMNIIESTFSGIWELPATGEVDIAGSGISKLDSRLVEGMQWSAPYYEVRRSLSIRAADRDRLRTIADFENLTISYTPGSTGEFDARQRAPASTRLVPYVLEEEAVRDLLGGKTDAIARGDVSSLYDARVNPSLAVTDLHFYDPREFFVFSIPSNNESLQKAMDEFLNEMARSGAIDTIVQKYLTID